MSPVRTLVAAIAAATLTLTGCGAVGLTGDGKLDYEDSPLAKYLSVLYSYGPGPDATAQEQQEFWNEQQRKTEELVAQCMTKEGFEYVPNTNNGGVVFSSDGDDMWRPDDREWVEKYGYGAANSPWQEQQQEQTEQQGDTNPEEYTDPNQPYLDSLTEAERQAYYEALWGKGQELDPDADPNEAQEWNWETAGCQGWAQHEVQGSNPWEQDENKPLVEAVQKFYEGLQNNPAFTELDAAWASCMAEKGFGGFTKQWDAQNSVYELLNAYWQSNEGPQGEDFGTIKDPEYAKIAETEIPLALADLECREKTDYRQAYLRAQFGAEEQFIADHREELDALIARAEQAKKE